MSEDPINQPPSEPVDIKVIPPPAVFTHDNGEPVGVQTTDVVTRTVETKILHGEVVLPLPSVVDIEEHIGRLRENLTNLVPAEDALKKLVRIRNFEDLNRHARRLGLFRFFSRKRYYEFGYAEKTFTERLNDIDELLQKAKKPDDLRLIQHQLQALDADVDIKLRSLKSTYIGLAYSLTTSKELVADLVQKIGPRELRDEAKMHLGIVEALVTKLNSEEFATEILDVLEDEFQGAVGIMTELEQRRTDVEELVYKDRARRQWTVVFVIAYIALVLALPIYVGVRWGGKFFIGDGPLSSMKLPLIGIPWPVIVWSLIGSFAAMIYRFNKKPIYDFGDAVKWMLTRPVQGVVLGAAFYLVLISGLFLFGGSTTPPNAASHTNDVILILSFLVGFSDRFADSVFNAIVDTYSRGDSIESPGKTKKGGNDRAADHPAV
jgi:hypothetical protein